jgi:hypothetical protein
MSRHELGKTFAGKLAGQNRFTKDRNWNASKDIFEEAK